MPTGTMRLAGRCTPCPVTVMIRSISGRPVSKTSAIVATEATFCTRTPTFKGNFPLGTSRSTTALISIFSAPCGYLTVSGTTSMFRSSGRVARITSMASGLLRSMPMIVRSTPRQRIMIRIPSWTRSGKSVIVRWSVVR